MSSNIQEKIKALHVIQQHLVGRYQKRLEWVRVMIAILTPSLVLLVGLQTKPPTGERIQYICLIAAIILISLTILIGMWLLLGETKTHTKTVDDIKQWIEAGKPIDDMRSTLSFPRYQQIFLHLFPMLVCASVLFLSAFGVVKFL